MNNEDKREQQIKFEKNLITFPYLGFAIVVLLFNIFYPDIKVSMALFGLLLSSDISNAR